MSLPPRAPPLVAWYPGAAVAPAPTMAEVAALRWTPHAGNPLLRPALPSPALGQPTFLPPDQTPDGQWHLFARGALGLHHFTSGDGLRWRPRPGLAVRGAAGPYLFFDGARYQLAYEAVGLPRPWGARSAHLELRASADLETWGPPRLLLRPCLGWHRRGEAEALGGACVIRVGERFRLYYSGGVVHDERGVESGAHVGVAEAPALEGPWTPVVEPVLGPGEGRGALGAGALKVVAVQDGFVGFQSAVERDGSGGVRVEVWLLGSADGLVWRPLCASPILSPGRVGGLDVRWLDGRAYLYFSAGRGLLERESVSLAVGA